MFCDPASIVVPFPVMASKAARRPAPPSSYSYRRTLQEAVHAKTCYFYKDGDYKFSGVKVAVHPKRYRRLEALYSELSNKMRGLPYGVRSIFTPRGRDLIRNIDGLEDDGHYVCSTFRHRAEGLDVNRVAPPARWNYNKPPSGQRDLNSMLHDPDLDDMPRVKRARYAREQKMANAYNRSLPKKITVLRNGEPTQRHILLINRRTAQTFDQILSDLSEMFQTAIRRLHTMEGRKVRDISLSLISDKFLIRVSEVGLEFFLFFYLKSFITVELTLYLLTSSQSQLE